MPAAKLDPIADFPAEAGGAPGEAFESGLIRRLFQEVHAELQHGAIAPALPSFPGGGESLPLAPVESYASVPPPVHPPGIERDLSAPAPGREAAGLPFIPSGEHLPGQGESFAFGEPREAKPAAASGRQPALHRAEPGTLSHLPEGRTDSVSPDQSLYFVQEPGIVGLPSAAGLPPATGAAPFRGFDVQKIRADFPALHQQVHGRDLVWFDNAATTHKPQSVIDATSRFYARDYSNVNRAAHALAHRATELYDQGRETVREFLDAASKDEIVFVRGTTEAINLVAQTFGKQNIGAGDEILLTTMEHHANIVPWKILAQQVGATLRVAPINDRGELMLEQFATLLSGRTRLVAITHVSNALGTINPIEHVTSLAHAYGVPVLVDGAQSTPHLPVNVQTLGADFFVFSGHKVFGPTGIGALYARQELLESMPPYQGGGSMISDVTFNKITYNPPPQKFEAGTQDIAGVVGLAAAIEYLHSVGLPAIAAYEHELLEYATAGLAEVRGIRPIGTAGAKASVLSFVVNGVDSEEVGRFLDGHGIAVRAGHHCAQPSLRRFGVEKAVRPSFAFYNTREEIDVLIRALHALPRR